MQTRIYYKFVIAILYITVAIPSSVFALTVQGGALILNIDNTKLANAVLLDNDPAVPSMYLEEYFDSSAAENQTFQQLLNDHIVPGTGEISATGLQFDVNGSTVPPSPSGRLLKATDFSFNASDLTGTATGSIGFGGALRFRMDIPSETNRVMITDLKLVYDANRVDTQIGHSGWAIYTGPDVFDLDNVLTSIVGDQLNMSGDLALATGFNHLGGQYGSIVGDFTFQTTVVPVPAALWLFMSGMMGLFVTRYKAKEIG